MRNIMLSNTFEKKNIYMLYGLLALPLVLSLSFDL